MANVFDPSYRQVVKGHNYEVSAISSLSLVEE